MGLVTICIPDAKVSVPPLVDSDTDVLFKYRWIRDDVVGRNKYKVGTSDLDTNDGKSIFSNVDGVGFMKSMLLFFHTRRIYNNKGPKYGSR